jgi:hypothetical protein
MGLMDNLNDKQDDVQNMREKTDIDDRAMAELKKRKKANQDDAGDTQ